MNTDFQVVTIPVHVNENENLIEKIGTIVDMGDITPNGSVYYLAEKTTDNQYYILGFSDKTVADSTCLMGIKRAFVSEYLEAKEALNSYKRENSKKGRYDWGTTGLYRDVEYFSFLAEQCHYLLEHDMEEHSLSFWREKAGCLNFTKFDFLGKGGYYTEYLPVQHIDVDGVDIVFDPNDIAQKAKKNGVVYQSVDEMLAFANAGDLAYSEGGVADE